MEVSYHKHFIVDTLSTIFAHYHYREPLCQVVFIIRKGRYALGVFKTIVSFIKLFVMYFDITNVTVPFS